MDASAKRFREWTMKYNRKENNFCILHRGFIIVNDDFTYQK